MYVIFFLLLMSSGLTKCNESLESIFTAIYHNPIWGGGQETVSGGGSMLGSTSNIRQEIPKLLKELGIKRILDAPCGDFHWMSHIDLSGLEYIGADIVAELIEQNKKKYKNNNLTFYQKDLTNDPLPNVDLIICRDLFLHLKNDDVLNVLRNFKETSAQYLLVSTFINETENKDREKVDAYCRFLNLQLPPFNFPEPLLLIEDIKHIGLCLGLWKLSDLLVY